VSVGQLGDPAIARADHGVGKLALNLQQGRDLVLERPLSDEPGRAGQVQAGAASFEGAARTPVWNRSTISSGAAPEPAVQEERADPASVKMLTGAGWWL
jgi:hypothetical protein